MKRIFIKGTTHEQFMLAASKMVKGLSPDRNYFIEVAEWKKPRTNQQNAFLWGVVYSSVIEQGGEGLSGWTRDDLHDYFLGECFGWETLEGFGRKRMKPLKRSSNLNKQEFTDYLMFIEQKCLDMGINIPEPNEPS